MHNDAIVFLINESVRGIAATYDPERNAPATVFKSMDPTIRVGDMVTVQTNTRHGFTVVKVTEVDVDVNPATVGEIKWVVGKLDTAMHEKTLEQEQEAIRAVLSAQKRKQREQLRAELFADNDAKIQALALTSNSGDDVIPPPAPGLGPDF